MLNSYKFYLLQCSSLALQLGAKQFAIDKIGALIGEENGRNFKTAEGYVNLDLIKNVLENCEEKRVKTRYKYENKEGVVKQRESVQTYAKIVSLNYEIKSLGIKIKRKVLYQAPEIIELLPDIKERKKFVGRFVRHKCTGVINYEIYKTLKKCAIKYLDIQWPS